MIATSERGGEGITLPEVVPAVSDLVVGGDGTVALELRSASTADAGRVLILDPSGAPLGRLDPPGARVAEIRGASVWLIEEDAFGVESILEGVLHPSKSPRHPGHGDPASEPGRR